MNNDKNSIYKYKYIKYKNKFLKLKSQMGGNLTQLTNSNDSNSSNNMIENNQNNNPSESVKEQIIVTRTECDTDCLINKLDKIQNDSNDTYKVYDQEGSINPN